MATKSALGWMLVDKGNSDFTFALSQVIFFGSKPRVSKFYRKTMTVVRVQVTVVPKRELKSKKRGPRR